MAQDKDLRELLKNRSLQYQMAIKDNVSPALDKMSDSWETMTRAFGQAEKKADKVVDSIASDVRDLSRKSLPEVKKAVEGVSTSVDILGDKVGEPTRYLAFVEALDRVKAGFDQLVTFTGFEQVEDQVQTMTQMTRGAAQSLRISQDAAKGLRDMVVKSHPEISKLGMSLSARGEGMIALIDAGARSTKQIADLAPLLAQVSTVAKVSEGTLAPAFYALNDQLGISSKSIQHVMALYTQGSGDMAVGFEDLTSMITKNSAQWVTALEGLPEAAKAQTLISVGSMRAALENQWAGGEQFMQTVISSLAKGAGSEEANTLLAMSGLNVDQWRQAMQTADGAEMALAHTIDKLKQLGATQPEQIAAFEKMYNMAEGSFVKLTTSGDAVIENMKQMTENTHKTGNAVQWFNDQMEKNTSWTKKLGNWFSYLADKKLPLLGKSMLEIGDFTTDVGATFGSMGTSIFTVMNGISSFAKNSGPGIKSVANMTDFASQAMTRLGFTSHVGLMKMIREWGVYYWARATGSTTEQAAGLAGIAIKKVEVKQLVGGTAANLSNALSQQARTSASISNSAAVQANTLSNIGQTASTTAGTTALAAQAPVVLAATFSWGALGSAIWAAMVPILAFVGIAAAIVAVVGAIGYIVYSAYTNWDRFSEAVWNAFKASFPFIALLVHLKDEIYWVASGLGDIAATIWGLIKAATLPFKLVYIGLRAISDLVFGVAAANLAGPFDWFAIRALKAVNKVWGALKWFGGGLKRLGRACVDYLKAPINDMIDLINWPLKYEISPGKTWGAAVGVSPIPKLAAGGIVTSPTMAMVGEAGPEVVMPLKQFMALLSPSVAGLSSAVTGLHGVIRGGGTPPPKASQPPSQVSLSQPQVIAAIREFMGLVERLHRTGNRGSALRSSGWGSSPDAFLEGA